MKKIFLIIAAAAMLAGCKTEEPTGIAVEYISHTIAAAGGTATFTVHPGAVQDWSISFPPGFETDWFDLSSTSGNGKTTVTATVEPNTDIRGRETTIIVTSGERNLPIIITQEAAGFTFEVNPESLTGLPNDEAGFNFIKRDLEVTSDISWYAEIVMQTESAAAGPWVQFLSGPYFTNTYGSASEPKTGNATVEMAIQLYFPAGSPEREAKVRFYHHPSGELLKEVPVSQTTPAIIFEVTPESLLDIFSSGERRQIAITSNITWRAEIVTDISPVAGPWVVFIFDSGDAITYGPYFGNETLPLYINQNSTGGPRETKIRFYNTATGALLKEVTVSQLGQ